ncbi:MAG: hypothetical protein P8I75_08320 [Flavobacteriaceae bacterium]|nr:hypothetical protein [Flavobacteriaceae bacterium]
MSTRSSNAINLALLLCIPAAASIVRSASYFIFFLRWGDSLKYNVIAKINPKGSKELKIISRKGVFVAKMAKIKNIEETKMEIFTIDSFKNHFFIFKKIEFRRNSL